MSDPDSRIELVFGKIRTARKAITDIYGDKRGIESIIPCPCCESGELFFSIASNGHIHAKCNTGKCVSWME